MVLPLYVTVCCISVVTEAVKNKHVNKIWRRGGSSVGFLLGEIKYEVKIQLARLVSNFVRYGYTCEQTHHKGAVLCAITELDMNTREVRG